MNDNSQVPALDSKQDSFFVKIKPIDADPTYYSMIDSSPHHILDRNTPDKLLDLINKAEIVAPPHEKSDLFEGISIQVIRHAVSVWSNIYITPDGDIDLNAFNKIGIKLRMRSSPELFKQLEEVIVYSKHAKPVLELDEEYLKDHDIYFNRVFDVKYTMNGKSKLNFKFTNLNYNNNSSNMHNSMIPICYFCRVFHSRMHFAVRSEHGENERIQKWKY